MADQKDRAAILDRVRKFINLAASPNLAEAERAAWKACQLIREHGLDLIDPDQLNQTYKQLRVAEEQVKALQVGRAEPEEDFTFTGGAPPRSRSIFAGGPVVNPFAAPPHPPRSTPPRHGGGGGAASKTPMTAPVQIPGGAKFSGKCRHCNTHIKQGDPALWQQGVGMWCGTKSCYHDWKALQTQAAAFNPFGTP